MERRIIDHCYFSVSRFSHIYKSIYTKKLATMTANEPMVIYRADIFNSQTMRLYDLVRDLMSPTPYLVSVLVARDRDVEVVREGRATDDVLLHNPKVPGY